jgi:hypothetical protein
MKKKIFLIGLFTLFSLTASEKPREKRTADQAELPDSKLPPKKRSNRNDTVIVSQQNPPTNHAISLPLDLPLTAAQAAQHVASQELPLPDADYHCPHCKGNFNVSENEHKKNCKTLNATIACPYWPCRRRFEKPGHLTAHVKHCPHRK